MMGIRSRGVLVPALLAALALGACRTPVALNDTQISAGSRVLATESFLADITGNIAGSRLTVDVLIPAGIDPHSYEPTPADIRKIAEADVVIANGAGLEAFLAELLENAGGQRKVVEASAGLVSRQPQADEHPDESDQDHHEHEEGDPHFWLDPILAIRYVQNIRDALVQVVPAGKDEFTRNADAYIERLGELDAWIRTQIETIPPERRLLVTNHESFGYFADRYGLKIVGAVLPGTSTSVSPSAQQLARLSDRVKALGAPAIFLETGANPQLAEQLARETGIKVITGLFTHSITEPGGQAPDYITMLQHNVTAIVTALR